MTTENSVDFRTKSRSVFSGKAEKAVSSNVAGSGGVARLSTAVLWEWKADGNSLSSGEVGSHTY